MNLSGSNMFKYLSKAAGLVGYIIQYGCLTHCTFEYIGDFVIVSYIQIDFNMYSHRFL